jgi:hypothetical protein
MLSHFFQGGTYDFDVIGAAFTQAFRGAQFEVVNLAWVKAHYHRSYDIGGDGVGAGDDYVRFYRATHGLVPLGAD